jgi:ubiquinone/menaquinone biosynthesis C-methylase UbiE
MGKSIILFTLTLIILLTQFLAGQDRYLKYEMQYVTLEDFDADGYVLAIGGGGEGTIGRLKGSQVIAIDISERELREAPTGPLKIIMDARELRFLDETFNTATSFFTLMYIKGGDHVKVMGEVFRVLKPGGKFLVWDAIISKKTDSVQDRVLVPLTISLPGGKVETGYGVRMPKEDHDLDYYVKLAEATGFNVLVKKTKDRTFYIELQKPISK